MKTTHCRLLSQAMLMSFSHFAALILFMHTFAVVVAAAAFSVDDYSHI